jgi:hypothetical protein
MNPYAAELLEWLAKPPRDGAYRYPESHRLSDEDLGTLLPAAMASTAPGAMTLRFGIETLARERQPRFTTEACLAMLKALAERAVLAQGEPAQAAHTLLRTTGPWPAGTAKICAYLAQEHKTRAVRLLQIHSLLALFVAAGQSVPTYLKPGSPLCAAERDILLALGNPALLLVADLEYGRPLPDTLARLAAFEEYHRFAHQALADAVVRAEQIQAGTIAYAADKAFTHEEVATLGRAARVVLTLDDPAAPSVLGALARAVAVAPHPTAKTLPSQALLYEIARSVEAAPTPEALDAVRSARALVRHKGVPKQLDRMLGRIQRALAERPGVALRLPDIGFSEDGVRVVEIGGHKATATAGGEITVPAGVRKAYPQEVKELRGLARQAKAQVQTLGRVLEAGFPQAVTMPMDRWRADLASGGLGQHVARRLIWVSDGVAALGEDVAGDAPVRLWHPLTAAADEVARWRELLAERELVQPFKQAYREVYPLTPAERDSGHFSLRFAGHVVRYKQMYALLKARGWQTSMLGPWDGGDHGDARRSLGDWRITLTLEFLAVEDGTELAGTGRISFDRRQEPARLQDVPPLVFSEAMRDVDLFVAVASIANDPQWTPERFGTYWRDTGFGELSATAAMRHAALQRLLPRLRIAERCELTDRFLVVRGDRFTYRIHLGSANILVEPSGAYLCIVAGGQTPSLFLPFEDDRLALILSKAFLLADDAKITDPSILRQLDSPR